MAEFTTNKNTISHQEINDSIKAYDEAKLEKQPSLTMIANESVTDFDSTLIAYFILFKRQLPNLKITIRLTKNKKNTRDDVDSRVFRQLRQFWMYSYLAAGRNVFTIEYKNGLDEKINIEAPIKASLNDENYQIKYNAFIISLARLFKDKSIFALSSKFIPPIYINSNDDKNNSNDYYSLYFKDDKAEQIKEKLINNISIFEISSKIKYVDYVKQSVIKASEIEFKTSNKIIDLAILAYVDALNNAKILKVFLYDLILGLKDKNNNIKEEAANIRIGKGKFATLRNKKINSQEDTKNLINDNEEYYEHIILIFKELLHMPLAYHFLFSIILSSEINNQQNKSKWKFSTDPKDITSFYNQILSIWTFTKDLVTGLMELAKNISEHSTTQQGIITARIHSESNNNIQARLFEYYKNYLSTEASEDIVSILNVNVIDLGEVGVIETLKNSTEVAVSESTQKDEELINLLEKDLEKINSSIKFNDLINPNQDIKLMQQIKRTIAHFGLRRLSRLISDRNGFVYASTPLMNSRSERDFAFVNGNKRISSTDIELEIHKGTQYCIVLPVKTNAFNQEDVFQRLPNPTMSTGDVEGLEALFSYQIIENTEEKAESNKNHIRMIYPETDTVYTHKDSNILYDQISTLSITKRLKANTIICIDFKHCKIDPTELFRLLGYLTSDFPNKPRILMNIDNATLVELMRVNELFCSDLDDENNYWSQDEATIIYSFINIENSRFYFTNVLWGETANEFISLNQIISRSHFNSISRINSYARSQSSVQDLFINSELFINENVLLPFDILLKYNNMSLFEYNASILLKNQIKPDNQQYKDS